MLTLPWVTPNKPEASAEAFVMASRLQVKSLMDVPGFLIRSLFAWRQVSKAPGAFGASLIADPFRGVFWTLSAWESREALYRFAATEPHRGIVRKLKPSMRISHFTFWTVDASQLPIKWKDAKQRLAQEQKDNPAGLHS
jgi:heme-degrading monooxygenase HmoA